MFISDRGNELTLDFSEFLGLAAADISAIYMCVCYFLLERYFMWVYVCVCR